MKKGTKQKVLNGVEDFTLACGTGVIASALVLKKKSGQEKYLLHTPGGQLGVKLEGKSVTLMGSVQISFSGSVDYNDTT